MLHSGDKGGRQARYAEQDQPDEHDPSSAEPVRNRAKRSINPPNTTAYAPVTHCNAVVEACSSRPMVGNATFKIELSSISKRNTADSPAKATHASRNDRGEPGDRAADASRTENSRHVVMPIGTLVE